MISGVPTFSVSVVVATVIFMAWCRPALSAVSFSGDSLLKFLVQYSDRSSGHQACEETADKLMETFRSLGLSNVDSQVFFLPVVVLDRAFFEVNGERYRIYPWKPSMASLARTPQRGVTGPLIYVKKGHWKDFNRRRIEGSIILMDLDSSENWIQAAMLGAKALVFLGHPGETYAEFREKNGPTPLVFPRFYVPADEAEELRALAEGSQKRARIVSIAHWEHRLVRNVYGLIPGTSPSMKEELVVLQAPYDATSPVIGLAPGVDQSTSLMVLLETARYLVGHPPNRSVLLVATGGSNDGEAGVRNFVWTFYGKKRDLRRQRRRIRKRRKQVSRLWKLVRSRHPFENLDPPLKNLLWEWVRDRARDEADRMTRESQYQKVLTSHGDTPKSDDLVEAGETESLVVEARRYRRLSWKTSPDQLTPEEWKLVRGLILASRPMLKAELRELGKRWKVVRSSLRLKTLANDYSASLFVGLSLSATSDRVGIAEWGSTYPLREQVRRQARCHRLTPLLGRIAGEIHGRTGLPNLFREVSRWGFGGQTKALAPTHVPLASDAAVLAGAPAFTLASLNDQRFRWGTPGDDLPHFHRQGFELLSRFMPLLLDRLVSLPRLFRMVRPGFNGLSAVNGRSMFIRQGELFADQPAPGTLVSAIQGRSVFQVMSFRDGSFFLPGVANKRVAFQKVILEPYGVDGRTGRIEWTADKVKTGKNNYRLKIKGRTASTTLIMFHCQQTDIVGTFDPRKLHYLTKVKLLDAVTGARPVRFWYSRIDGRDTLAISVFLEKGTRFKLLLADTLLRNQFLLLNGSEENPEGQGFLVGHPAFILRVPYKVAEDIHYLVKRRLSNLHNHGIVSHYLEDLFAKAEAQLAAARSDYRRERYDRFWSEVITSWAKLDVVYGEIEKTQNDVLGGVLFFIALFVPFAFCMERYLFCFRNIYQQVVGFFAILIVTIAVIRALHPAFQLTYNPMVVILAFFIVGLSLLVSWIIFMRFEHEMDKRRQVQTAASAVREGVNPWQAFGAGFVIGASNLHRRRLRTALTSTTLVILTFTIMSFTNVKSIRTASHTRLSPKSPYRGILFHDAIWRPLLPAVLEDLETRFDQSVQVWPRAWLDRDNPAQRTVATLAWRGQSVPVEGVLGIGTEVPRSLRKILLVGRWPAPRDRAHQVVIISDRVAEQLGFKPEQVLGKNLKLWETPVKVIGVFDADRLDRYRDLDGHPVTPAYLEVAPDEEISEVEVEAMESGEEILPMTERFRFARAERTIIVPYGTCLAFGGTLKSVTLLPGLAADPLRLADRLSKWFAYPLYVGDGPTWFFSSGRSVRYQGVANLFVPILLVALICLNTMIGHVHERKREIGVYTSVGLAPSHVGFLFIVEALSLAVLSTVVGYIIAQLTAKFLAHTLLFSQLTFNYSSLASIMCMILVFTVVLIASLYPARLAAHMAMPDVTRTWSLPRTKDEVMEISLPFLLKPSERKGVMGFLGDFFRAHQDLAHGPFITDLTRLEGEEEGSVTAETIKLKSLVWLAPFDFGIKQRLVLQCVESQDDPGYLEVHLRMQRESGEWAAWFRANKNFVRILRKQMLLWRFLDEETKQRFASSLEEADVMGKAGSGS